MQTLPANRYADVLYTPQCGHVGHVESHTIARHAENGRLGATRTREETQSAFIESNRRRTEEHVKSSMSSMDGVYSRTDAPSCNLRTLLAKIPLCLGKIRRRGRVIRIRVIWWMTNCFCTPFSKSHFLKRLFYSGPSPFLYLRKGDSSLSRIIPSRSGKTRPSPL